MAKSKKQCYISVPSHIINTISSSSMDSLLLSPKKHSQNRFFSSSCSWSWKSPKLWLLSLFFFALIGMLRFPFNVDPCFLPQSQELIPNSHSESLIPTVLNNQLLENVDSAKPPSGDQDGILNQPPVVFGSESGFWKQPDGMGYKPCIENKEKFVRVSRKQRRSVEKVEDIIAIMMANRAWTTRLQNSIRLLVPKFDHSLFYNVLHATTNSEHALQFVRRAEHSWLPLISPKEEGWRKRGLYRR